MRVVIAALALVVTLVLGACATVAPAGPATPAGTTAATPAAPADGATTQPEAEPTQVAAATPGQSTGGNLCDRVTLDEISAAAGGAPVALGEDYDTDGECNWDVGTPNDLGTPAAFLNLRRDFSTALEEARELWPGGEELEIGDDAYFTPELNVVYVQKGGTVYAVQVVVVDADQINARDLMVGVAQSALPRL
jgi:hypothetical protein